MGLGNWNRNLVDLRLKCESPKNSEPVTTRSSHLFVRTGGNHYSKDVSKCLINARGVAADDASWRGATYGARLRVDHWNSQPLSSWQADRQLRGDDPQRGLQWRQATAMAYQ